MLAALSLPQHLDDPGAGVARVDHVIQAEAFRRTQRTGAGADTVDQFLPPRCRVGRRRIVAAKAARPLLGKDDERQT